MKTIRVKAKEGRIARESPRGDFIPQDRFVRVDYTNYIRRLIEIHGDLIVEETPPVKVVKPAPKPAAPASTAAAEKKEN